MVTVAAVVLPAARGGGRACGSDMSVVCLAAAGGMQVYRELQVVVAWRTTG
jgi:hypothetical protein